MNAREQIAEEINDRTSWTQQDRATARFGARIASDRWEPIMRELVKAAESRFFDAPRLWNALDAAREALGETTK